MVEPLARPLAPLCWAGCGTQLAATLLACPACGQLVYAARLKELAAAASELTRTGELAEALARWREALELLPPETRQHAQISERIAELGKQVAESPTPATAKSPWKKLSGGAGAVGLGAWKLKAVLAFVVGQGKLLLLGLTKWSTFASMLVSFGVYFTLWGWKFALGFVAALYVHEMGHVFALRRYGIAATAPTFIPGFGAFVRLKQTPRNPHEDAAVGLAGPIWGLAAAFAFWIASMAFGSPMCAAIAKVAALMNLFNLLPLGPLDGGRAFNALTRTQRGWIAAILGAAYYVSGVRLLLLLVVVAGARWLNPKAPTEPDRAAFVQFAVLVVALTYLSTLAVQPGG